MDFVIIIIVFFIFLWLAYYYGNLFLKEYFFRKDLNDEIDKQVVFRVKVPLNNEYEIKNAEQMFAGICSLFDDKGFFKKQKSVSFEIVAFKEKINFFVVCHEEIAPLIDKMILGAYPSAEVVPDKDYNLFVPGGFVEFSELRLSKESYFPIKDYEKITSDSMNVITGAMTRLSSDQALALQYIVTPASEKWRKQGRSVIKSVEEETKDVENNKSPSIPQEYIQAITEKISKIGLDTTIRIISVASTKAEAKTNLHNLKASFEIFGNPEINYFAETKFKFLKKYLRNKKLIEDFITRTPPLFANSSVLTINELATIFHYPNKDVETPYISWLLAKKAPADEIVHQSGLWLGTCVYRGSEKDIYMGNIDDRRRHMYIIGQTGTGKSKFMDGIALQDIKDGKGLCFIDPHGEEIEWLLERIPPERAEDVIYWNPADTEKPFGFNILENMGEHDKHMVVNSFYKMIQKLFDPNNQGITGPLLERAMRSTMLTAMAKKGSTLMEVMKCLLLDWEVINDLKAYLTDQMIIDYWEKEIPATPENRKGELLGYFTSKLDRFVSNKLMRNMLAQSESSFNLRQVMDEGKILLINLSKGSIGAENSEFLGLLLIPRILAAAMSRIDTPPEQRRDFFLYVDEFQNFATDDFATILSEARKFRLNLIVANQYIGQMKEEIKNAIFGNVGTIVAFRVGTDDAEYLERQFSPIFSKEDLSKIENQNAYIKLLVDGKYPSPFSMRTTFKKWPEGNQRMKDLIIQISRNTYGRDVDLVEEEINQRVFKTKEKNNVNPVSPQINYSSM